MTPLRPGSVADPGEFEVVVLGVAAQHTDGPLRRQAMLLHQRSLSLPDQVPGVDGMQ